MSTVGDARVKVQMAAGAKAHKLLPYVARVSVPGEPANAGDGTFTETSTSLEGVPCDVAVLGSYERMSGGALTAGAEYALEFPYVWDGENVTIPANAVVDVEETDTEPARSFEVVGPLRSGSLWKQRFSATLKG